MRERAISAFGMLVMMALAFALIAAVFALTLVLRADSTPDARVTSPVTADDSMDSALPARIEVVAVRR